MDSIKVGLIGFGTVGTGVAKILLNQQNMLQERTGIPVILKRIVDLDTTTDRGVKIPDGVLSADIQDILNDEEINVVVEVIGGENPAQNFIKKALAAKKNVVTSNKEVIAKHGLEFTELAKENNVSILYEAAVGGGIPVLHAMRNSLSANKIERVFGIVNGTTNYILSKMAQSGADFSATLKEAQDLGYAEANPKNDVEGYDVAYKLAILAGLSFRCSVDYNDIYREGISEITSRDILAAKQFGYTIKMLATGINHGDSIELRVHPVMIENSHPLASVNDVFNAIYVRGDSLGEAMFYGRGAGELPTASAVVGDIMCLAFDRKTQFKPDTEYNLKKIPVLPMGRCVTRFFLSCQVKDEPGVLASLATLFSKHHVSIRNLQQTENDKDTALITMITHPVKEEDMQAALQEAKKLPTVKEVCSLIRVGLGE